MLDLWPVVISLFSVKADFSQKGSEDLEMAAAAGSLGPDLTASVETTYSEQSSSSAGSSASSDQPIYFRYVVTEKRVRNLEKQNKKERAENTVKTM